jgi:hypothetical protein
MGHDREYADGFQGGHPSRGSLLVDRLNLKRPVSCAIQDLANRRQISRSWVRTTALSVSSEPFDHLMSSSSVDPKWSRLGTQQLGALLSEVTEFGRSHSAAILRAGWAGGVV